MKKLVTAFLIVSLGFAWLQDSNRRAEAQIGPSLFVLGVLAVGAAYVIITVTKHGGNRQVHTFVLQQKVQVDRYNWTWVNVCTNQFTVEPYEVYAAFIQWKSTNTATNVNLFRIREISQEEDYFLPVPDGDGAGYGSWQPILHP